MTSTPDNTEPQDWHRYFAVESSNRAWDLAEKPSRTQDEVTAMLNAAHTAAWHWSVVGTELNHMRASVLLALVHAHAGYGDSALRWAQEARAYFLSRETDAWELAIVHSIHAYAAIRAGNTAVYKASYGAAKAAVATVTDPEDRRIVLQTFNQVPPP